jgi:mitofusin
LANGFPDRYSEFQDFERKFEECISKSALRTKFEQHLKSGKLIVSEIRMIIIGTYNQAEKMKAQKAKAKEKIHDKRQVTEKELSRLQKEKNDKIQQMVKDVEQMVSCFRGTSVSCTEGKH